MKLATYGDGSRDGQLLVVARDLGSAHYAAGIATRLQQVLDDWNFIAPQLQDLYERLNAGKARHAFPFEPRRCAAPLPRAYQFVGGPAHDAAEPAAGQDTGASLQQCASDDLLGPCDDLGPAGGVVESEIAVVTGDLRRGCAPEAALEGVRLLMLAAGADRRAAIAFAPLALTPDEAGAAWRGGRLHAELCMDANGRTVRHDTGAGMRVDFGGLLARVCASRNLRAGSIVGGGPVAAAEAVRIEAVDADGRSLFGAIEPGLAVRTDAT